MAARRQDPARASLGVVGPVAALRQPLTSTATSAPATLGAARRRFTTYRAQLRAWRLGQLVSTSPILVQPRSRGAARPPHLAWSARAARPVCARIARPQSTRRLCSVAASAGSHKATRSSRGDPESIGIRHRPPHSHSERRSSSSPTEDSRVRETSPVKTLGHRIFVERTALTQANRRNADRGASTRNIAISAPCRHEQTRTIPSHSRRHCKRLTAGPYTPPRTSRRSWRGWGRDQMLREGDGGVAKSRRSRECQGVL